eukprot:1363896-Rhodomonas_salina.1
MVVHAGCALYRAMHAGCALNGTDCVHTVWPEWYYMCALNGNAAVCSCIHTAESTSGRLCSMTQ